MPKGILVLKNRMAIRPLPLSFDDSVIELCLRFFHSTRIACACPRKRSKKAGKRVAGDISYIPQHRVFEDLSPATFV